MDTEILFTLGLAVLGGAVPPLVWLWFWLKEDAHHPEPKILIIATFIAGMITVPIAGYLEKEFLGSLSLDEFIVMNGLKLIAIFFVLVLIEEIVKYLAARGVAFPNHNFDEPIDAVIYLITAALGFAALENILFLIDKLFIIEPGQILLKAANINQVIAGGNLRFIGANVLHAATSGILGVFIALSFYKGKLQKILCFLAGLFLATSLHAIFNFLIIRMESKLLLVFAFSWALAIILILLLEKVKRIKHN
jgi:RsiW-degrading membrane proteinase PrsW (M82 family)